MKITELIELLQKAKNENGDIEVVITDTYCESEVDWNTLGEVWGEPTPKAVFLPKDNTYNERGEKTLCLNHTFGLDEEYWDRQEKYYKS